MYRERTLRDFPAVGANVIAAPNWVCAPVGVCRDSDSVERANFDALLTELAEVADEGDYEVIRFAHWAVGWVEEIFCRPNSLAFEMCADTRRILEDYPVLDERLLAEYEAEYAAQNPDPNPEELTDA